VLLRLEMIIELLLTFGGIIAIAVVVSPCSKISGHAFLGPGVFDSFSDPSRSCSSTCRVGRVIAKTPFFRAAGVRERQVQLSHTANTTMSVVVGAILMMSTHKL
jgi:hypothetical protein